MKEVDADPVISNATLVTCHGFGTTCTLNAALDKFKGQFPLSSNFGLDLDRDLCGIWLFSVVIVAVGMVLSKTLAKKKAIRGRRQNNRAALGLDTTCAREIAHDVATFKRNLLNIKHGIRPIAGSNWRRVEACGLKTWLQLTVLLFLGTLRFDGVARACSVPLTPDYYQAIQRGEKSEADVTCILGINTGFSFNGYEGDVTLGAMPALESIDGQAFEGMKGVLNLQVGDSCTKLKSIKSYAFRFLANAASVVSFGALPNLTSIEHGAFDSMRGTLKFEVGDSCTKLRHIDKNAFENLSEESVVSFGALPQLISIGGFAGRHGKLTFQVGDSCQNLEKIDQKAFYNLNSASVVSFGALPMLESVGDGTFQSSRGTVNFEPGPCPKMNYIGAGALQGLQHRLCGHLWGTPTPSVC
jgi:hypothetical protein